MFNLFARVLAVVFLFCCGSAQAGDYKIEWDFSDYHHYRVSDGDDPIVWSRPNAVQGYAIVSNPWQPNEHMEVKEFHLTIGDREYDLADANSVAVHRWIHGGTNIFSVGTYGSSRQVEAGVDGFVLENNIYFGGARLYYGLAGVPGVWEVFGATKSFAELPVAAVPEPEMYAMFLGGLCVVGAAVRSRRKA